MRDKQHSESGHSRRRGQRFVLRVADTLRVLQDGLQLGQPLEPGSTMLLADVWNSA